MVDIANEQRLTARDRVLAAARSLFSEHGVSGTSLQMIADRLGVTKAAVYHQFHAKEEIIRALMEQPVAQLQRVISEAETQTTREAQLDVLLPGLVDIVLENPDAVALIETDPAVARLIKTREEYRESVARMTSILAGANPDPAARVASALYGAGLMLIGHHPLISDIDAETLRRELPRIGRRALLT